jgi:tetratricopeptide (TPR) repeat protein
MANTIDSLKQKIQRNPASMENYTSLGELYEKQTMFQQAIDECYMHILKYEPYNGVILNQIGVCYFCLANYNKAITFFKKVIEIKKIGDVYRNIAMCYIKLKLFKKAEKHCVLAYNLEPWHDDNKSGLAELYYYYKQYDRSIEFYRKIKTIENSFKHGYNIAFPYLGKRDFKTGFHYYEFRLKENNINPQTGLVERLELPQIMNWNGTTECNHLLLIYEQGIGDNIQYFRFAIQLAQQNPHMKITYFCKNTIAHLLNNTAHGVSNIEIVLNLPHLNFDYKTYIMSLPHLLKLDTIAPNTYDYIKIDAYKTAEWRQKLSPLRKFRVGFTYNGLLSSFIEKYVPLSEFLQLCDLDVDLICIHKKSEITADIEKLADNTGIHLYDIDEQAPFVDTVHILKNIDLLITIDTYIVHFAGAMNVKTWLLLGKYSEWRWSNESKTYWYDSVEIIRNEEGDLCNVIPSVKTRLQEHLVNKNVFQL